MQTLNQDQPIDRKEQINQDLDLLRQHFPSAFPVDPDEVKPLRIRIDVDVYQQLDGEVSHKRIKRAIGYHCLSIGYLKALAKGGERYNLVGQVDGYVPDTHQHWAQEQLRQRTVTKPQRVTSKPKPKRNLRRTHLGLQKSVEIRSKKPKQVKIVQLGKTRHPATVRSAKTEKRPVLTLKKS